MTLARRSRCERRTAPQHLEGPRAVQGAFDAETLVVRVVCARLA